jgi:hypothetical protein
MVETKNSKISRKNTELWSFKTWVLETTLSDLFGQTLDVDHDSFQQKNLKHDKAIYKYIRATNNENIDYLNYLLAEEDWGMFMKSMPLILHT